METIKVWVRQSDLHLIQESQRPTQYWLNKPDESNVSEISISITRFTEWQKSGNNNANNSGNKRQILHD